MPRNTATKAPRAAAIGLWNRLQGELKAGRYAVALDLARQFHAQHSSDSSISAIREALIGLANQYVRSDKFPEVRRILDEAENLDCQEPAWLEQLAILRAKCGDWPKARGLLDRVPGTTLAPLALAHVVDKAVRDPKFGRNLLTAELQVGFDAVTQAFAHYDRGEDEAARQALQPIGMQSPFLDWKLLIRGLLAYSTNDDARAIENWQRLDVDRLPAQIAAPFRFQIDVAFRGKLPPEQAKRVADRSDGIALPMLASLRKIQRLLSTPENLASALRQVRPLVGMLKLTAPQQLPRLANCFYWLIIQGGEPEDMDEFEVVFGKPVDDPNFSRLIAMVMESSGRLDEAHKEWKQYSDWVASQPQRFPGEFGKRARAMIALRMGDNAVEHERDSDEPSPENFLDFIRRELNGPGKAKSLKPTAEACYRSSMELSPDWKEPLSRLLDFYAEKQQWDKAEPIGRRLTEKFPDDSEALVQLSEVLSAQGKNAEALEALRIALKNNPLDSALRTIVAQLTMRRGREQALSGEYDDARASFKESLNLDPEIIAAAVRASWAACEFKAGCPEVARRLASELQTTAHRRVSAAFLLLAETTRVKSGKLVQAEFKSLFDNAMKGDVDYKEFMQLLGAWSLYRTEQDRYHGFGTHEKKIFAKVKAIVESDLPEDELARFGLMLVEMRLPKPLKILADKGQARFGKNVVFCFLSAQQMILQRPKTFDVYRVSGTFAYVLEKIEAKEDPLSVLMRHVFDRTCEEHPRLRELVEQQREMRREMPHFGGGRMP